MTRPKKVKALERLRKALNAIPKLKNVRYRSPEFTEWRRATRVAISNTFGEDSRHIADFRRISFSPKVRYLDMPDSDFQADYVEGLKSAEAVLVSMIEEVEEYWEDESQTSPPIHSEPRENEQINTNEVFIVHGRDEGAKNAVGGFIKKLDLVPVILHEQANQGRTIIEKFEEHAKVGFAIALLTPDDVGALKGNESNLKPKPRARQNVIFEFGYFIGKIGRKRVCALVQGDVEKPSDYDGVLYIPLDDSGGWKIELIKELKAAGFDVDANQVFQT